MRLALKTLQENKVIFSIFICALILRLLYLSPWLEDWDSVSFAQALHNYSLTDHRPHPPGYPLYILLGKVFYLIFRDDAKALTTLSAILGSAAVFIVYAIAQRMFGYATAVVSAIFFVFAPVSWMLSVSALTNIPGLFFLLISILFIYSAYLNGPAKLNGASFLAGVVLGVRFTEAPVLLSLLLFVIVKQGRIKSIPQIMGFFLLGVAVWLIPLLLITGPKEFFASYLWIASYVLNHDAGLGRSLGLLEILTERTGHLWELLRVGYTIYFVFPAFLFLFFSLVRKTLHREFNYQFLFIWILSYLIPLTFVYNLEVPRYTLPLLVPLVILFSTFVVQLSRKSFVFVPALVILTSNMFVAGYRQVDKFAHTVPPTVAAVKYVQGNFKQEETEVIASFTFRQFQYYAPEFTTSSGFGQGLPTRKIVLVDHLTLKEEIEKLGTYTLTGEEQFRGDREVFPRIPEITIYAFSRD